MCHICNMARCPINCPNHKECVLDFYDKDELLALLGVRAHPASRESIKGILTILGEKNEK